MATIPSTPGRSGMPGTPNLRLGTGMVSPDDLGANQWGEITRLGRTIGMAGNELQQWSMRKYDEEAQAESLQWQNSNMRLLGEESNRIKTLVGEEAANGPKAYEDYARGLDEDAMKNLKTPLAKRLYQQRMQQFNNQQGLSIDAHTLQEHERTMQVSLAASVQQEIDNAASNAGNGIAFVDAIQRIKGYNAQRFHGMPAEYIEQQNRNNSMLAIQSASARLANDAGTQAALDFLNSGVDAEIGGGALKVKFDELRKTYEQSADNAEISRAAMSMVDSEMAPDAIMRQAYSFFPDDKDGEKARRIIQISDVYRAKKTDAANMKAAQYEGEAWSQLAQAGYSFENIPKDVALNHPVIAKKMGDYIRWLDEGDNAELDPNFGMLDSLHAMKPSELRAWLAEAPEEEGALSNYQRLYMWAGSEKGEVERILARSRMSDDKAGGSGGGRRGSSGAGEIMGSGINDWFQNVYPSMYGGEQYDDKGAGVKSRQNGFRLRINARMSEKESDPDRAGKPLNEDERKEILFNLIKDVRGGRVTLESSCFDEMTAPKEGDVELPVRIEELSPEEKAINRGENVVLRMNPATKQEEKFGVLDMNSSDTTGIGVPVEITKNAAKAERAYQKMPFADVGDNIVTMKDGSIEIWDRHWTTMKNAANAHGPELPPEMQEQLEHQEGTFVNNPEPKMSGAMQEFLEKNRKSHGAENVSSEWTGKIWTVSVPGEMRFYSSGGELLEIQKTELPGMVENSAGQKDDRILRLESELKEEETLLRDYQEQLARQKEHGRGFSNLHIITLQRNIKAQRKKIENLYLRLSTPGKGK